MTHQQATPSGVAVIGTGLIGASIAMGLRAQGYAGKVVGAARRSATRDAAMALGCFDQMFATPAEAAYASGQTGLVVVCVPLGAFGRVFHELRDAEHEGLTITDAGSTKLSVVEHGQHHLQLPHRLVPAHPMAGSEQSGPQAGRADLFAGKPCIVCPNDNNPEDAIAATYWLWETLQMRILEMTAEQHDEQAAIVSHLPHAAAVMLVQAAMGKGGIVWLPGHHALGQQQPGHAARHHARQPPRADRGAQAIHRPVQRTHRHPRPLRR